MSVDKKMRYSSGEQGYKSVTFKIRMSKETYDKLDYIAQKKGMTKSEVIRRLIEKSK